MQWCDLRQLYQPLNHNIVKKDRENAHFWQIAYATTFNICSFFKLCSLGLYCRHMYMPEFITKIREFSLLSLPSSSCNRKWNAENRKESALHFYICCYLWVVKNVQRQRKNFHLHKLKPNVIGQRQWLQKRNMPSGVTRKLLSSYVRRKA